MNVKIENRHGKLLLIGASLLIWIVILALFKIYGYQETYNLWRVPTEDEVFLDFQLIPGSAESFRNGFEPSIINPYDPEERLFNYPAIWRLFFYTGITQADTLWIGVCMIILFFLGVFLFPERLSILSAIGMLVILFSPASMLLYERCNVDLIVFFLCALIIYLSSYSANITAILLTLGILIKMYPFFGITVLLKEAKGRFWAYFTFSLMVLLVYTATTWNSVKASWSLTQRGREISYGANIIVTRFEKAFTYYFSQFLPEKLTDYALNYGTIALSLLLIFIVLVLVIKNSEQPVTGTQRNFAAFRMGASIYIGTFLLGNNWDYRLVFLVLVVPQLMEWAFSSEKRIRIISYACMGAVIISCWHFIAWYSDWITSSESRIKTLFIFDELINWMLMVGLAYLLVVSMPDWLKEQIRSLFPKWSLSSLTQP